MPEGDPTTQVPAVTPTLAEQQQSGSTAPTTSVSTQASSGPNPYMDLVAQWEKRHRDLMSDKDKMANDRDKAIAAQVEMQKELTSLQERSSTALNGAAQTTQSAIEQAKLLADKIAQLEAENVRNKVLLENPDLAAYASLIQPSPDEAKVREAVENLKKINEQHFQRLASKQQPPQQQIPVGGQQPQQVADIMSLYAGRPGMNPMLPGMPLAQLPGSTPAAMAPAGSVEDQNQAIEQILKEARESGDPQKFAAALEEAKNRQKALINSVTGYSS